jgi:hypothetical protein
MLVTAEMGQEETLAVQKLRGEANEKVFGVAGLALTARDGNHFIRVLRNRHEARRVAIALPVKN